MSLNEDFEWRSLSLAGLADNLQLRRVVREINQRMQQLTTPAEVTDFRQVDSRTATSVSINTEEFDAAGPGFVTSGFQRVATDSEVLYNFMEYTGSGSTTAHISHRFDQDVFTWRNAWAFDDTQSAARAPFASLDENDATPDVDGAVCWRTNNSSPTTITAFDHTNNDDGLKHLFILLIDDANTTIDFSSSSLEGNQGVSWVGKQGDMLLCVRGGGTSPVTSCTVPAQSVVPAIPEIKGGTASGSGTTITVTHGMVGTPTSVVITGKDTDAATVIQTTGVYISAIGATTFTINHVSSPGATVEWYWLAIVN